MYQYSPDVREQGDTDLRKCHLVMLEILKVIDKICDNNNLKYWLDAGTLLGAVRHKGFIPWDDDLDICMLREDYEKFLKIAEQELPDGLYLQTKELSGTKWKWAKIRDNYSTFIQKTEANKEIEYHQGIFVDIFPYDLVAKDITTPKRILNRDFKKNKGIAKFIKKTSSTLLIKTVGFNRLKKYFLKKNYKNNSFITTGIDIYLAYDTLPFEYIFPLKRIKFEGIMVPAPKEEHLYLKNKFGDYMQLPSPDQQITHAHKIIPDQQCNFVKLNQLK